MVDILFNSFTQCASGDHVTFEVEVNSKTRNLTFHKSDLKKPITREDAETTVRVLLRLMAKGKTLAQVKAGINNRKLVLTTVPK